MHDYLRASAPAGWCGAVIGIGDKYVPGLIRQALIRGHNSNLGTEPCGGAAVTLEDDGLELCTW